MRQARSRRSGSCSEEAWHSATATSWSGSQAVADLEGRGYVERTPSAGDRRVREVVLTDRGVAAVEAGRRHRAALDALGADPAIRGRRVRPPR